MSKNRAKLFYMQCIKCVFLYLFQIFFRMELNIDYKRKGDPSSVEQLFTSIRLKIWCCRYWQLQRWNTQNMAFPYWRIYWNRNVGGTIGYGKETYKMTPDFAYIITPNTPYYSFIETAKNTHRHSVLGKPVVGEDDEDLYTDALFHLYIHFNIGLPFDNVGPAIYPIALNSFQLERLEKLSRELKKTNQFDLNVTMYLQALLFDFMGSLPDIWNQNSIDKRILQVIRFIDRNISHNYSNETLASLVHMATNSFARLFKENMKVSVQHFIKKRKIYAACGFFDHSRLSIEVVSQRLGFADRYHFSRIFKQIKGCSPGVYQRRYLDGKMYPEL